MYLKSLATLPYEVEGRNETNVMHISKDYTKEKFEWNHSIAIFKILHENVSNFILIKQQSKKGAKITVTKNVYF